MASSPRGRRFDWTNLGERAMSATVLAPVVLIGAWLGGWAFLLLLAAAAAVLAVEWAVMSAPQSPARVATAIALAVLAALLAAELKSLPIAWAIVAAAALICAAVARGAAERPLDAAFGAIYIAVPCLALAWLRSSPQGLQWTFMLFAVTWSADVAAYASGNLLKGPKLWPRISPNKTWAGFFGGLLASVVAAVGFALVFRMRLSVPAAALMGLLGGMATMGGDLLESVLKRRFGVKNSGDLIPGHGGLLDRVDGLLFAVLVVAAARLVHLAGWAS